jgi:hypothetical protein
VDADLRPAATLVLFSRPHRRSMKKYTESELESLVERVDALGGYL